MAKAPDPKSITNARVKRTEAYAEKVRQLFAATVNEIIAQNKTLPEPGSGIMYSFDGDSKKVQAKVEMLLRRLHSVATLAIQKGISIEWEKANAECDRLVRSAYGQTLLNSPVMRGWQHRNNAAKQAFINRSDNGMNLSDRVWQSCRQLRDEMEIAITVAIGEGNDAGSISRQIRHCLNNPDDMFRRFRYKDEDGNWQRKWKKRVKDDNGDYHWIDYDINDYHTGRGVYRSSAKNAMRVARTETNIAYRRADHNRWQQMDFVLGQRVHLSRNHPKKDICDKLAGDYPKDFVFDGWHPQCFCFVTPILVDASEMQKANEAFLRGEEYTPQGTPITDYPQGFKDFVRDNADNIKASRARGTEPYFVRNNQEVVDNIIGQSYNASSILQKDEMEILVDYNSPDIAQCNRVLDGIYKRNGFTEEEIAEFRTLVKLHRYGLSQQREADFDLAEALWDSDSRIGQLVRFNSQIEEDVLMEYIRRGGRTDVYRSGTMERDQISFTFLKEGVSFKGPDGEIIEWSPNIVADVRELLKEFRLVGGMAVKEFGYGDEQELFFIRKVRKYQTEEEAARVYAERAEKAAKERKAKEAERMGKDIAVRMADEWFGANKDHMLFSFMQDFYKSAMQREDWGGIIQTFEQLGVQIPDENNKKKGASTKGSSRAETRRVLNDVINEDYVGRTKLSDNQKKDNREIAKRLGLNPNNIQPMTFMEADEGNSNIHRRDVDYKNNCVSCVVSNELRRRGLDVTANIKDDELSNKFLKCWLTEKGENPKLLFDPTSINYANETKVMERLKSFMNVEKGRYIVGWDGNGIELGHILCAERIGSEIIFYDPQLGKNDCFWTLGEILSEFNPKGGLQVIRIDNLRISSESAVLFQRR